MMTLVTEDPFAVAAASADRLTALAGPHDAAVVLGSGWSPATDAIGAAETEIPLAELGGFPASTVPGQHYETPAEITMLGRLGADLVGMSTVLEAIAARHLGAEVLGISLVTNLAAGLAGQSLSHAEVVER